MAFVSSRWPHSQEETKVQALSLLAQSLTKKKNPLKAEIQRFGPERDRCRDRVPPTGGGEATSHSAPFQGRIFFNALQLTHGGRLTPCRSASDYFHHRHQGRLSGAVSADWAVCSRTWSSCTSRRRASSSSAWAWTWAWRVVTRTSRLLSWLFKGWLSSSSSTSHRNPWGVGSWWAVNSPLPMRRRIVSVETPKRRAASPIDTFSTTFLPSGMGNSICVCGGGCLGVAWAGCGRFWLGLSTCSAALPKGGRASELFLPPVGPPRTAEHGRSAGRRYYPDLVAISHTTSEW